ncbi:hypothetical protein Chor_009383 [Crotalus horridus]
MQKQHLEVVIASSKRRPSCKRSAETWEENQPVYKRSRTNLLVCPMEREASLLPESNKCSYYSTDMPVTSRQSCPTAQPSCIYQPKEAPHWRVYDPFDFTSDELNPAYEWLGNSSSAGKCADVISLLRSILSPFPLGLRLNKLEAIVWSKHKIHLLKLSLEQGYRDSLQFLQAMPGIILKFQHKKPFRCLVQLDTAGGKVSH